MEDLWGYREIISKLKEKGISFENGLSIDEIKMVEKYYNILFPIELNNFYLT